MTNPNYGAFSTIESVEAGTEVYMAIGVSSASVMGLSSGNAYYFNIIVSDEAGNKAIYQAAGEFIDSNLVVYYPFDGNSIDVSPNGNLGVVTGAILTTDRLGNANKAYKFSGTDYIRVASPVGIPAANAARTYCAWAYPTAGSGMDLISYGVNVANQRFSMGRVSLMIKIVAQSNDTANYGSFPQDAWTFACATHNGTTAALYINGSSVGSEAKTFSTTASPLLIGKNADDTNNEFFFGSLDNIRIFSRALSAVEILALYTVEKQ